jgi:signal peptidase II
MHRKYFALILPLFLFGIDRVTKWLTVHHLPNQGYRLFSDFVTLSLEKNQGIAYSIRLPQGIILSGIVIAVVVLVGNAIRSFWQGHVAALLSSGLVIIGALSNLIDRVRYGYVIDMFAVRGWSVFNLADVWIVVGAIWLCILLISQADKKSGAS